jgi:hypothetical protein
MQQKILHAPDAIWLGLNAAVPELCNFLQIYVAIRVLDFYDYNFSTSDGLNNDFEESHHLFRGAFPEGFPWELLKVKLTQLCIDLQKMFSLT